MIKLSLSEIHWREAINSVNNTSIVVLFIHEYMHTCVHTHARTHTHTRKLHHINIERVFIYLLLH